jgi:hypothetical protein
VAQQSNSAIVVDVFDNFETRKIQHCLRSLCESAHRAPCRLEQRGALAKQAVKITCRRGEDSHMLQQIPQKIPQQIQLRRRAPSTYLTVTSDRIAVPCRCFAHKQAPRGLKISPRKKFTVFGIWQCRDAKNVLIAYQRVAALTYFIRGEGKHPAI